MLELLVLAKGWRFKALSTTPMIGGTCVRDRPICDATNSRFPQHIFDAVIAKETSHQSPILLGLLSGLQASQH
jgi:hypothetical protein